MRRPLCFSVLFFASGIYLADTLQKAPQAGALFLLFALFLPFAGERIGFFEEGGKRGLARGTFPKEEGGKRGLARGTGPKEEGGKRGLARGTGPKEEGGKRGLARGTGPKEEGGKRGLARGTGPKEVGGERPSSGEAILPKREAATKERQRIQKTSKSIRGRHDRIQGRRNSLLLLMCLCLGFLRLWGQVIYDDSNPYLEKVGTVVPLQGTVLRVQVKSGTAEEQDKKEGAVEQGLGEGLGTQQIHLLGKEEGPGMQNKEGYPGIKNKEEEPGTQSKETGPEKQQIRLLVKEEETGRRVLVQYSVPLKEEDGGRTKRQWLLLEGRTINVCGEMTLPAKQRNPHCFDYAAYLKGQGVQTILFAKTLDAAEPTSPWRSVPARLKTALFDRLEPVLGEERWHLLEAMLFGDKSGLGEEYETWQKNGTAHVLAVSGLHVGMVYSLLLVLLRRKRSGFANSLLLIALLFYGWLAAFSASVMRAVIMIGLHGVAGLIHRPYDLLTGAATAAFALLIWQPYQLFQTGFQLSFLAVITLAFVLPLTEKKWGPAWTAVAARWVGPLGALVVERLLVLLLPITVLQIALIPYIALQFNYVSLSGFLANYPLVFLAGLLVPFGIALLPFLWLGEGVFWQVTGRGLAFLLDLTKGWNTITFAGGAFSFDVVSPPVMAVVAFYATFFLCMAESVRIRWGRQRKGQICLLLAGLVICTGVHGGAWATGFEQAKIVFVDVGQGSCIHVQAKGKSEDNRWPLPIHSVNLLFDGGGKDTYDVGRKVVKPYLLKNGVGYIDIAFVTHLDTDHYAGIVALCQEGMVRRLVVSKSQQSQVERICRETGLSRRDILFAATGDVYAMGEVKVEIVWAGDPRAESEETQNRSLGDKDSSVPANNQEGDNANGMVMKVWVDDVTLLVAGDIGEEEEKAMLAYYRGAIPKNAKGQGKSQQGGSLQGDSSQRDSLQGDSPQDDSPQGGGLQADILQVPHHGSKNSSTAEWIEAVNPSLAVVQVGRNHYGHPAPQTMERYEEQGVKVVRNDESGAIGVVTKARGRPGVVEVVVLLYNRSGVSHERG